MRSGGGAPTRGAAESDACARAASTPELRPESSALDVSALGMDAPRRWYSRDVISRRLLFFAGLAGALLAASACSKPEPPTLVPKEAKVTAIGPLGLDILLRIEATNPNRITLSTQNVTGKATLDGKWDLGTVTVAQPLVLPPNVPTTIDVPMKLPWSDVKALGALATATGPMPYTIEGTVGVGGEKLNVNLPFSISGTITREQIASAALKAMPALPGLDLGAPR